MSPVRRRTSHFAASGRVVCLLLGGCASAPPTRIVDVPPPTLPAVQIADVPANGSIYRAGSERALFEDRTARRVGDVITIVLTERTDASKSATTKTSKSQSVQLADPTVFGRNVTLGGNPLLSASIEGDRDFNGEGASQQSNRLTGSVTVQVISRHPNGNLLVKGEKWLTLNQGQELVRIEGIVRPTDIAADNTVASTQVADARITYSGRGALADSNTMGWLARVFNHPVWPF